MSGGNTVNMLAMWRLARRRPGAARGVEGRRRDERHVRRRRVLVRGLHDRFVRARRCGRCTAGSASSAGASSRTTTARRSAGRSPPARRRRDAAGGYGVDDGAALVFHDASWSRSSPPTPAAGAWRVEPDGAAARPRRRCRRGSSAMSRSTRHRHRPRGRTPDGDRWIEQRFLQDPASTEHLADRRATSRSRDDISDYSR